MYSVTNKDDIISLSFRGSQRSKRSNINSKTSSFDMLSLRSNSQLSNSYRRNIHSYQSVNKDQTLPNL